MIDDFKDISVNIHLEDVRAHELNLGEETFSEELKKETEFEDYEYLGKIRNEISLGKRIERQQKLEKFLNLKNKNRLYKLIFKILGPESSFEVIDNVNELNIEELIKRLKISEDDLNKKNIEKIKKEIEKDFKDKGLKLPEKKKKEPPPASVFKARPKTFALNYILKKKSMFFSSNYLTGIDIGYANIKFIQIRKSNGKILIDSYKVIPFKTTDDKQYIQNLIKTLRNNLDFDILNISRISVSFSDLNTIYKLIKLPVMEEKELSNAVEFKINKEKTSDIKKAKYEYKILNSDDKNYNILGIISDDTQISEKFSLMKNIDIEPDIICPKAISVLNTAKFLYPEDTSNNVLILDIGKKKTALIFVSNQNLRQVREINISSESFTEALIGSFSTQDGVIKVERETAEHLKIDYGITYESSYGTTDIGISIAQIGNMLKIPLEKLINEINISIENIKSTYNCDIEKILLTGGGAKLKNIDEFITEGTKIETEIMKTNKNILGGIEISDIDKLENEFTYLTQALGCALNPQNKFNFLPEKAKERKKARKINFFGAASFILIIVLLFSFSIGLMSNKSKFQKNLLNLKNNFTQIQNKDKDVFQLLKKKRELQKFKSEVDGKIKEPVSQIPVKDVLKIFSSTIPKGISLHSLKLSNEENAETYKSEKIVLSCKATSTDKNEGLLVTEFVNNIQKLDIFRKVSVSEENNGLFIIEIIL